MQFGGQRTDLDLKPIGKPDNILVKLTDDILPQPEAVLVHGITPQKTRTSGMSEAEFAKYLSGEVFTPDTIAVGYNNVRFDNKFIRFLFWRNFTDAYEWAWKNGCSTWDFLDVVRTCRALRPDGIKWPFASDGKPSNKLELLASVNKFKHDAHDALGDVKALVELARLIKSEQPKLFDYLLKLRSKDKVAPIVNSGQPFIYTSGRYPSEWQKTTVVAALSGVPERDAAFVYDLRIDPDQYKNASPEDLLKMWTYRPPRNMQPSGVQGAGEQAGAVHDAGYFPIKQLVFNRCPAVVADLRVLDKASQKRLGLHMEVINNHFKKLAKQPDLGERMVRAMELSDKKRQPKLVLDIASVDGALYEGFVNDADKIKMGAVRAADAETIADFEPGFSDERLNLLLPLYKGRNFPASLSADETKIWQDYKKARLDSRASQYQAKISELSASAGLSKPAKHLLTDLADWGQFVQTAGVGSVART